VLNNARGDNMISGVATLLLTNASLTGRVRADCLVIEAGELHLSRILASVPASVVLVGNFFRDQLDRAGEMETVIDRIAAALSGYRGQLVLNGDDPNAVRLADAAILATVSFFGVDAPEAEARESAADTASILSDEAGEGKFCPRCGARLIYGRRYYSHIGRFSCPACGFGNNPQALTAGDISADGRAFTAGGVRFAAPTDALYAVYNATGAATCALLSGIPLKDASDAIAAYKTGDGRMESFPIGENCLLNLIKNPTGANEVLKYILRDPAPKNVLIALNDNIADGRDVSWIWDARFDLLASGNIPRILCTGRRAWDMALRIKYGDFPGEIEILPDMAEAVSRMKSLGGRSYVIATYTALHPMRQVLTKAAST